MQHPRQIKDPAKLAELLKDGPIWVKLINHCLPLEAYTVIDGMSIVNAGYEDQRKPVTVNATLIGIDIEAGTITAKYNSTGHETILAFEDYDFVRNDKRLFMNYIVLVDQEVN